MSDIYLNLVNDLVTGNGSGGLLGAKAFPWLSPFTKSLDSRIRQNVRKRETNKPPPYNPYAVEDQFRALTPLLDRCLQYRKEYEELEVLGIRHALDYTLFLRQIEQQRALEEASWIAAQRRAEKVGQENAGVKFSKGNSSLELGFTELARGMANSASEAITGETSRTKLAKQKWDALQEYQTQLEKRHGAHGNGLNFVDRAGRVFDLLFDDFWEATLRARALSYGLRIAFGLKEVLGPPSNTEDRPLDALLHWTRAQVDKFNFDQDEYTDVEFILPIRPTKGGEWPGLMSEVAYRQSIDGGGDGSPQPIQVRVRVCWILRFYRPNSNFHFLHPFQFHRYQRFQPC